MRGRKFIRGVLPARFNHQSMSKFGAATILVLIAGQANAQTGTSEKLNEYLERITQRGFSGAVLAAKGGKVILTKGYGTSGPHGGPVTPDTVFDLASVTKQLTAAAILKLEM